jgi:N,N-dimethylformamidase
VNEVSTKIVVGYADRFSAAPGETIRFMVSVDGEVGYRADIVKLTSGDWNPRGAGFKEELVTTTVNGEYQGRKQEIHRGHSPLSMTTRASPSTASVCRR